MQALSCQIPHEACKELLTDYFEELRIKFLQAKSDLENPKQMKRRGPSKTIEDDVFLNFILWFFRIQGILFTKIGLDEVDPLIETWEKQLKNYVSKVEKLPNKHSETVKMQHISFIIIFMAHFTISEASREIEI
jgi:hypothetical protein